MAFEGNDTFTGDHGYWRQGFLESAPAFAYPCVIVLGITAAMGTFGNFITILVICRDKMLHTPDSVFIANLAFSDMFVTSVAIPFSIIGKYLFLDSYVASIFIPIMPKPFREYCFTVISLQNC